MNIEAGIENGATDNLYLLKVRIYWRSLIFTLILDAGCSVGLLWTFSAYLPLAATILTVIHVFLYLLHYSAYMEVYLYNEFLVINHPFRLFSRIKLIQYSSIKVLSVRSWKSDRLPALLRIMYYEDCMKKRYDTKWLCKVEQLSHMITFLREKGMKVAVGSFKLQQA
jgi:hypothetical protein